MCFNRRLELKFEQVDLTSARMKLGHYILDHDIVDWNVSCTPSITIKNENMDAPVTTVGHVVAPAANAAHDDKSYTSLSTDTSSSPPSIKSCVTPIKQNEFEIKKWYQN